MASGEFIEVLSPKALENLNALNASLDLTVAKVSQINSLMGSASTPSSSNSAIKDMNAQLEKQALNYQTLQQRIEATATMQTSATQKMTKSQQSYVDAVERGIKAQEREQAKLQSAQNLYNITQKKLNELSNEYKNIAIKKELDIALTEKEEIKYRELQLEIKKHDMALKAVDATMGKYTRNVGNYASGFHPLSNSINQLTREAPAFANSLNTGFMALSNNIPIFFDAMKQVIAQNKVLQAQGKPTESALKQLASAFFSWQTALSVGVTLLTLYGAEIVDYISGIGEAEKAQQSFRDTMLDVNSVHTEQMVTLETLRDVILDTSRSEKDRVVALNSLKKIVPELNDVDLAHADALTLVTYWTNKYVEASMARAKADMLIQEIAKLEVEQDKQRAKSVQEQTGSFEKFQIILAKISDAMRNNNDAEKQVRDIIKERIEAEKKARQDQIDALKKQASQYLITADKLKNSLQGLMDKQKEGKKDKRDDVELIKGQVAESDNLLSRLEKMKKVLTDLQRAMSTNNAEWEEWQLQINAVQDSIDILTGKESRYEKELQKNAKTAIDALKQQQEEEKKSIENLQKYIDKIKEMREGWIASFGEDFVNQLGFKSLNSVLDGSFEKMFKLASSGEKVKMAFLLATEFAQDALNVWGSNIDKRKEEQLKELEQEKEIAMKFAGDNAEARAKIEKEYEDKKRAIELRDFKVKQKIAMTNIIIDTAQGVMATIGKTGFFGIPLALIVGAMGLAQLAMVASQKPPAFAKGTDFAPRGLAVTDEEGAEIQTDSSGRIKDLGSNKGARLKFLERGDKIIPAFRTKRILQRNDFEANLSNILTSNGIGSRLIINNGVTASEMDNLLEKHLASQPKIINRWDKDGFSSSVSRNGNITKRAENRGSGIGISV